MEKANALYQNVVRKPSGQFGLMKFLITSTLLTICLTATGQTFSTKKALTFYPGTYIDTEYRYTDSTGLSVIIQNSSPKWGGFLFEDSSRAKGYTYTSAGGKKFGCVIFWYRIINETDSPLELTLNFPADSFAIQSFPESYFKLFLPSDTMNLGKEAAHSYGLTGLRSFLDSTFYKPTRLQRTIDRRGSYMFYIALLDYYPEGTEGVTVRRTRAELVLDETDLFYDINLHGSGVISCGQIISKN
jgi:hypothetical protein